VRAATHPAPAADEHDRLARLFDDHADRLYRLARRLTASREDARDLLQETFLRAARSLAAVPDGQRAEEAWLVRVLVNAQRDAWRRQRVRKETPLIERACDTNVEHALHAKRVVWRALGLLQPRRRAVIVMHDLEGSSVDDIARLLGIARVTVRWHLSVGRRALRQLLKGELL
jgi:RNA polymerase sigma-70 factor (ECF subfamily)